MTDALNQTTTYEYDKQGRQIATIDALGRRTASVYNDKGELVETIAPDSTPTNASDNPRMRMVYDAAGRKIAEIDPLGRETRYGYDKVGRLVEAIAPGTTPNDWTDNARKKTEYYTDGLVKAQIDERGNRTEFRYDALGRQIAVIAADSTPNDLSDNPTTRYVYDQAGQQQSMTDALGHTTRYVYDDLGRMVKTVFADQTFISQEYDQLGRRVAAVDQNGKRTEYRYDDLGRLTGVKNALLDWTTYGYNEQGQLVSLTDAESHTTGYEYDSLGRRTATILPMMQKSSQTYDEVGNLKTATDFNGQTIAYHYDEQNRLAEKRFQDGSKVVYTYTLNGQRDTIAFKNAGGQTTEFYDWDYDVRDRLTQRIDTLDGVNRSISYTYDVAGNRTSVTTASGTINYTFDERNRLDLVKQNGQILADYDYDTVSNLIRTKLTNGTEEVRQYDRLNRLKYLENHLGTTVISSFAYTLDKVGNRTEVLENSGRKVNYTYDDLYRLTQEAIDEVSADDRTLDYNYDRVGNRLGKKETSGTTTRADYGYDANDRLLWEKVNGATTTNYTYDGNGSTKTKTEDGVTTTYIWNDEKRMIGATVTDAQGVVQQQLQYRYNDDGIRVSSSVNGQETRFLLDEVQAYPQVLEEYAPSGMIQVSYVYGNDLISQAQGAQTTYYHVDGLGSTAELTDTIGNVVSSSRYDAFGVQTQQTGAVNNKYLFAGEQFDQNLGDYYLRARYYDSSAARFTARDFYSGSMSNPLSQHKYIYAHDNPVTNIDPTGLLIEEEALTEAWRKDLEAIYAQSVGPTSITIRSKLVSVGEAVAVSLATALELTLTAAKTLNRQFGIPVVFWGQDVSEVTSHQFRAVTGSGYTIDNSSGDTGMSALISPALHRSEQEYSRGWLKNQPQSKGAGKASGLDRDEFPYAHVIEGGYGNYLRGKVSIHPVNRKINRSQGSRLKTFWNRASVQPYETSLRDSLFLNIPVPALGFSFGLNRGGQPISVYDGV